MWSKLQPVHGTYYLKCTAITILKTKKPLVVASHLYQLQVHQVTWLVQRSELLPAFKLTR